MSTETSPKPRLLKVAAAQVGAVHKWSERAHTLERLVKLLRQSAERGAQLVLFPETTLTTFFPRHFISDEKELDSWFEHGEITESANAATLFQVADELGVDICVGYAERTQEGHSYNTCVYYSADAHSIIQKYHKSHLPGTKEPYSDPKAINQLEKRYFEEGQEGFRAFRVAGLVKDAVKKATALDEPGSTEGKGDPVFGLLICNDRRWSEAWRVYGLQVRYSAGKRAMGSNSSRESNWFSVDTIPHPGPLISTGNMIRPGNSRSKMHISTTS